MVSLLLLAPCNSGLAKDFRRPFAGAFFMLSFFILLFLSASSHAMDPVRVHELAQSRQWLNLGHYKERLFGQESQEDGAAFFLAKDGKSHAESELMATIEAFEKNDVAILCRFPARYLWLRTQIPGLNLDPRKECPVYREFVEKVRAQSVSLIFSSYYINTPASAFGHTFLRFNSTLHREDNQDQAELLDYGINFAAKSDGSGALLYALKGLLGLYPGVFTAIPYYYKVREYNDFESRDLWEYKLKFTQPQIDLMAAHVWELAPLYFDYLYFTENCSYHILALLEVGNPELNLTPRLPALYVIPIDTVRVVSSTKGFVVGRRYRPSVLSRLERHSARLPNADVEKVRDLVEHPETMEAVLKAEPSEEKKAEMLETAVEAYDFLNAKDLVFRPKETIPERHRFLVARSEVDVIFPDESDDPKLADWPDQGHGSQRWGAAAGYRHKAGAFTSASMRFALHDLLDPLPGQPTFSQITFADLEGRVQQNGYSRFDKAHLDKLDIFRVSSFQPITHWQRSTSWDGRIGLHTIQDNQCHQCLAISAEAGVGATVAPRLSESFVSLMNKFHLDYSDGFAKPWRLGIGPELWARWVASRRVSVLGIAGYKWTNSFQQPFFVQQIFTQSLEVRYHASKEWSYSLKGEGQQEAGRAYSLGFFRYF